jgi:hypothetical protein
MISKTLRTVASPALGGLVMLAIIAPAGPSLRESLAAQKEPGRPKGAKDGAGPPAPVGDQEQALKAFLDEYRLAPGQNLKRIPPPRPAGAGVWSQRQNPAPLGDVNGIQAIVLGWRDPDELEVRIWMSGRKEGWSIRSLPDLLKMDLDPLDIEGDPDILETELSGDWIVREGVPPEQLIQPLEAILQRAVRRRISVTLRRVERDVVVARGRFRPSPLPGHAEGDVEVYAHEVLRDEDAGGGRGAFSSFLNAVAHWIDRRIVNEVESPPERLVTWRYNRRWPPTEQTRREDHDEALVLKHLQEQTGLTFTREKRPARILFVEQAKSAR